MLRSALIIVGASAQDLFLAKSLNLMASDCSSRSSPSDEPFEQLCYLLKKNRDTYDISWAPPHVPPATFQDHIPYDLVAQFLLGASAEQLNSTYVFHEHSELLAPAIPSKGQITAENWQKHVGENAQNPSILYSDYVEFYRAEVKSLGAKAAMERFLPALVDGVFGKLFHGMQTLGWGYGMTGDEDMVAQGLAWMSTAFAPPAPLSEKPSATDLAATLVAMHKDERLPVYPGDPTMFYEVYLADLIANHSRVLAEYDLRVADEVSEKEAHDLAAHMADTVMNQFAAYNFSHFTNVHFSGSVFAMDKLMDFTDSRSRAVLLRRMWQAVVYNFAIQSRPSTELPPVDAELPTWEQILARSFNQTDVHVHELVYYTMKQPHPSISDERLRQCAHRALRLFEQGGDWDF